MEHTKLEDILSGNSGSETESDVQEEPQAEEPETESAGQPRGPDGKFAAKEETGVEKPQQEAEESVVPTDKPLPKDEYQALKAERQKRQEAEARIAALEQYYQQMQQQPKQTDAPDFWDDPTKVIQSQISEALSQFAQQQQQQQAIQRVDQSEKAFRAEHPDFDEKLAAFRDAVQANPRLAHEMAQADNPAKYAYERGKTALALSQHGSIDDIIAAERAKWEESVKASIAKPNLPQSTAQDGSTGGRSGPEWSGPTPLSNILDQ